MKAPMLVGLTGGIAAGKSTVSRCFEALGVPVVDADQVAREVVAPGSPALREIRRRFGAAIIDRHGSLDRPALRRLVFSDPARRRELEALLHPLIRERMFAQARACDYPYCIVAVPLLAEGGLADAFHRVALVDVPAAVQRQRLRERDGSDEREIEAILATQASREERLAVADDVIDNSGPEEALAAQVEALHRRYLQLAASRREDPP